MRFLQRSEPASDSEQKTSSEATTPVRANSTVENDVLDFDDSPVAYLTWRSFFLGVVVSMGGFIFGYSTGELAWSSIKRGQCRKSCNFESNLLIDVRLVVQVKSPASRPWETSAVVSPNISRQQESMSLATCETG